MLFQKIKEGLIFEVKVNPGSRLTEIKGLQTAQENGLKRDRACILKISLNEVPEKGSANKALLRFLAMIWGLPKSQLALVKGETYSSKVILIKSPSYAQENDLLKWEKSLSYL
jgi:uncharacterized protein YggU (UPF0235/DUF167 family)